jgi:hypothetical protein
VSSDAPLHSAFAVVENHPFRVSPHVALRRAGKACASLLEGSCGIKPYRKSQLIAELLGKSARSEAVDNAANELLSLRLAHRTMLQTTAHHGSRPPVPQAPGFSLNKLYALVDCSRILKNQPLSQIVQVALR